MSLIAVSWAMQQELGTMPKMALMVLAEHYNGETGQCNPSIKRIATMAGMAERTVERQLKDLVFKGYVKIEEHRREDGSRTSNQYNLLMAPRGAPKTPGGGTKTPGGSGTPPPGSGTKAEQEPGIEPGIKEPGKEPLAANKNQVIVTDEFRRRMVAKYDQIWPPNIVNEIIDEALNYKKASVNWKDAELGVQGWLRREAAKVPTWKEGQNGRTEANIPANNGQAGADNSRAAREQRIADQRARASQVLKVPRLRFYDPDTDARR